MSNRPRFTRVTPHVRVTPPPRPAAPISDETARLRAMCNCDLAGRGHSRFTCEQIRAEQAAGGDR